MYYFAEEFIRGNHLDPTNHLRWDKFVLNLLGNEDYNLALPNVYKWDSLSNTIAGDIIAFVDDLRVIGYSFEKAWAIARQIARSTGYFTKEKD